jgi:hypothetical protein
MLDRELREIEARVLKNSRVEGHELEALRRGLYKDGRIGRNEADFLVVLHKRVQHRNPEFEKFFYKAIKDHILADGRVTPEETAWLRQMLFADGMVRYEERQFLRELNGEAREASPEFEALFKESMKQPPERHTSG